MMLGLYEDDITLNDRFERFFEVVQDEARSEGGTFYIYGGDGDVEQVGDMECETLTGWLIDDNLENKAEFVSSWLDRDVGDEFDEALATAKWTRVGGGVAVVIKKVFS